MIQGIKVIDFHTHFPNSGEPFPDYKINSIFRKTGNANLEQAEVWRKAYNFPAERIDVEDDSEGADIWYQDILDKDIEKVVFVSGGGNQRLSKIISCHPDRFIGFAHHHPFKKGAAEELEQAVTTYGFKGYKVLATAIKEPLDDTSVYPVWEVCRAYSLPVIVHFGILGSAGGIASGKNISPLSLHDVARDFPEVTFIVPHFSAGYPRELLHLCWACPNVCVDTSGSNQWIRWMPFDLTLQDLFSIFYRTIGPDRIIFATDSSWFPRGFAFTYLEEQHRIMRFLHFSEEDIEKVLFRNAGRLLGIGQAN